jgi:hypothetical protein
VRLSCLNELSLVNFNAYSVVKILSEDYMLILGQQRVAELMTMESLCAFLIAVFLSKYCCISNRSLLVTFKIFTCLSSFVAQSVLSVNDS